MEDIEDTIGDDGLEEPDEAPEDGERAEPAAPAVRTAGSEDVESIQDLLVKRGGAGGGGRGHRGVRPHPHAGRAPRRIDGGEGGPAAGERVHMPELLPGEASEPAEGQGEDALPGLRLRPNPPGTAVALLIAGASGALLSSRCHRSTLDGWRSLRRSRSCGSYVTHGRSAVSGSVWSSASRTSGSSCTGSSCSASSDGPRWSCSRHVSPVSSGSWRRCCGVTTIPSSRSSGSRRCGRCSRRSGSWPLGGFAWGQLGTAQTGNPALLRLASVTGVWGMSFVVVAVAGLLPPLARAGERGSHARCCARRGLPRARVRSWAVPRYRRRRDGRSTSRRSRSTSGEAEDLSRDAEDIAVARMNIDLHALLADDPPDLAVWGEGSLDPGASTDQVTMQEVVSAIAGRSARRHSPARCWTTRTAASTRRALLFDGTVTRGWTATTRSCSCRSASTCRSGSGWVDRRDRPGGSRSTAYRGRARTRCRVAGGVRRLICHENSFPSRRRDMARRGAEFLVLTTNNACTA